MSVTRRKFISLLGASLAVAKAGVCALPRWERATGKLWDEYHAEFLVRGESTVTVGDLQKEYAAATSEGHPDVLYWSHDADLDTWPKMEADQC